MNQLVNEQDLEYIRRSLWLARKSRDKGNHRFGALLVDDQGQIVLESVIVLGPLLEEEAKKGMKHFGARRG